MIMYDENGTVVGTIRPRGKGWEIIPNEHAGEGLWDASGKTLTTARRDAILAKAGIETESFKR